MTQSPSLNKSQPRRPDRRVGMKASPRPCEVCGQEFSPCIRAPHARFCSRSCIWKATKGPDFNARIARESAPKRSAKLKGTGEGKSYPKLLGRHEHRVIAERKIGRSLVAGEVVHHRDEDFRNNSPDNLQVLQSQGEHLRLHLREKKQSPEHVAKRVGEIFR